MSQNNIPEIETQEDLNEILRVRREKLSNLIENGKNPFEIVKFDVTKLNKEIIDNFDQLENQDVTIAGRIMRKRDMGKASFVDVRDSSEKMQVYIKIDDVGEESYESVKKIDIGDIVGIKGFVFRTKRGEISVHAKEFTLLSKSLLPLPEKFHGLRDTEIRYRQRYLDLIVNPEVKNVLDRSIGSSTPLSTYRGKQMHHTLRYGKHDLFRVFTYGDITEAERATFELIAARNALNDGYRKSEVVVLKSLDELEGGEW